MNPARRLGVFGGMFDPPHNGHVAVVRAALAQMVTEVVVVPAGPAPSHRAAPTASAELRLEMCRRAFADIDGVAVDEVEVLRAKQGGSSYMIDTARELAARDDDAGLVLLVGTDQLTRLHTWHEWRALVQLVGLAVVVRPGSDGDAEVAAAVERVEQAGGTVEWCALEPVDVSSTRVRELLGAGEIEAAARLVPAGVVDLARDAYARV